MDNMPLPLLPALLATFLGGAVGGGVRFGVMATLARTASNLTGPGVTQSINFSGSLAIGAVAGLPLGRDGLVWTAVAIGFLGSYTTVSAFSLDLLQLVHNGERRRAVFHATVAILGCPTVALIGYAASNALAPVLR